MVLKTKCHLVLLCNYQHVKPLLKWRPSQTLKDENINYASNSSPTYFTLLSTPPPTYHYPTSCRASLIFVLHFLPSSCRVVTCWTLLSMIFLQRSSLSLSKSDIFRSTSSSSRSTSGTPSASLPMPRCRLSTCNNKQIMTIQLALHSSRSHRLAIGVTFTSSSVCNCYRWFLFKVMLTIVGIRQLRAVATQ